MWTDTTRAQYARAELALPSDLTDAEWALLEPFFPAPCRVGRPRKWPLRRIVEAILYLPRGGLPWRMLPPCFPPVSTVRRWFYLDTRNNHGFRAATGLIAGGWQLEALFKGCDWPLFCVVLGLSGPSADFRRTYPVVAHR